MGVDLSPWWLDMNAVIVWLCFPSTGIISHFTSQFYSWKHLEEAQPSHSLLTSLGSSELLSFSIILYQQRTTQQPIKAFEMIRSWTKLWLHLLRNVKFISAPVCIQRPQGALFTLHFLTCWMVFRIIRQICLYSYSTSRCAAVQNCFSHR